MRTSINELVGVTTPLGVGGQYISNIFCSKNMQDLVGWVCADQDGRLEVQFSKVNDNNFVLYGAPPSDYPIEIPQMPVDKCFWYDAGYTDETTDINDNGASDVEAPPDATGAVGDAIYFMSFVKFGKVRIQIGTQGNYVATQVWEYYNGSSWVDLSVAHNLSDGTDAGSGPFTQAAGTYNVTFDVPDDMAQVSVNNYTLYAVRCRTSAYTSTTAQPLLTQAWIYPVTGVGLAIPIIGPYWRVVFNNGDIAQTHFNLVINEKGE